MDLRIFVEPQQGTTYAEQCRVAQAAELLGFDAFFRSDHYVTMGGDGLPGPTDAWATLAGLACETSRIRLGTLVTSATFRLPGPLAITVAQVDAMSAGRVELGIGAGWYEREHAAYGIPFPALAERFERLEEQLAVVTGLWSTAPGETFSHTGRHYRLVDSPALPKPYQRPGPPVIVGGVGPRRTPALAARYAAELNVPFASLDDSAAQFARGRAACEEVGRDPETLLRSVAQVVCCGADSAEVARRADAIGRPVDELRRNGLCGTPDEVVDGLTRLAAVGAERVYLQFLTLDDLDHLELIGEQVLPRARSLRPPA